jgi:hypothetical protein
MFKRLTAAFLYTISASACTEEPAKESDGNVSVTFGVRLSPSDTIRIISLERIYEQSILPQMNYDVSNPLMAKLIISDTEQKIVVLIKGPCGEAVRRLDSSIREHLSESDQALFSTTVTIQCSGVDSYFDADQPAPIRLRHPLPSTEQ